jgi:hypothetical protein
MLFESNSETNWIASPLDCSSFFIIALVYSNEQSAVLSSVIKYSSNGE